MPPGLVYCPHCDLQVAERTYRRHKNEFYSPVLDLWQKKSDSLQPSIAKKPRQINDDQNEDASNYTETNDETISLVDDRDESETEDINIERIELDPVSSYIEGKIEEVWEDVTSEEIGTDLSENTTETDNMRTIEQTHIGAIARWTVLFVSSWSIYFNISATAVGYLLTFLHALLAACGIFSPYLLTLSNIIPKTIYNLRKSQNLLQDDFTKYVVCPQCDSTYRLADVEDIKVCTFVEYPNHHQRRFRQPCNTPLFKEITLRDEKIHLYPTKIFPYRSIRQSLQDFLSRPGFQQKCEMWRQRSNVQGTLRDVYDGRVWKSFMRYEDRPFLELPRRYGLLLNIDWFQPYAHSPYSSGGIYLSLLNLPRNERYRKENVISVGIIPGPHEPSKSVNTFLKALVDELNDLWYNGFKFKGKDDKSEEDYYVALFCCSCDVPATRKVCGFLGHSAKSGCSKCKKNFKSGKFGDKMNYGGFDGTQEPRKDPEHRDIAEKIQQQDTLSARQKLQVKHGVRYSELMRLPYFNCITSAVIDPMHNLFLGTAKHMFKSIWSDKLTSESLKEIQKLVDNISVPTSLGRIPRKIESSFSSFTADQWKNWTLFFSPVVLKDYLPKKDYNCWLLFVEACRLLCAPTISIPELRKGHEKMMEFCRTFEKLYGSEAVTPNMHLHTHLIECVLDFGPFHGYWLYGFERMNGILGSFHTNKRSPEIQFMRKMREIQSVKGLEKALHLANFFAASFDFDIQPEAQLKDSSVVQRLAVLSSGEVRRTDEWIGEADINFLGTRFNFSITEHFLDFLCQSISQVLDVQSSDVSGLCSKHLQMEMCGENYGSSNSRLCRSSVIMASWCGTEGDIQTTGSNIRPGIIRFFVCFHVNFNGEMRPVYFAFVHWFQKVPYHLNSLVTLWCRNMFEPEGPACFMPVQRIKSKAVCAQIKVNNEPVLAVIPLLPHRYY